MDKEIKIQKTIYSLDSFNNVIDTKFSQLATTVNNIPTTSPDRNVEDFFNEYNSLFFDIPKEGSENSHQGLASRSLEYLGVSLEDLQLEIDFLRQENTELKNQILQITGVNEGDLSEI